MLLLTAAVAVFTYTGPGVKDITRVCVNGLLLRNRVGTFLAGVDSKTKPGGYVRTVYRILKLRDYQRANSLFGNKYESKCNTYTEEHCVKRTTIQIHVHNTTAELDLTI